MTQPEADAGEDDGEIARVPSHVSGLDAVLCGGFLQGGLYMVQGPPGAGKTILASQILYGNAAAGGRALFVTVLGENHGRMFTHLRPMRFFDPSVIPDKVAYISAFYALEDEGLKGLSTLLRREVQAHGATLLVLDGMSAIEEKAGASFEMKRFTHELQTLASVTDCTMFLLTTASGVMSSPQHTMVDGLIELRQRLYGLRNERRLQVHKIRGSAFLEGEHAFRITRDGVTVFPRIEALLATPTRRDPPPPMRVSSGIASLDAMFGGGIPAASVTALVGPAGAGKTTLGLHFLSSSSADEPGLLFGCDEPPERLRLKAAKMGLGLAAAEQRGDVELLWYPIGEHILDELAHRLLDAVRRRGVKRLVIDGVSGFQQAALEPERIVRFWSVLSNELRARGTQHRLRCAVQLCTLRATGRFIADYRRVPLEAVNHLAAQLGLDPLLFLPDPERPATESAQLQRVRQHLGWREFDAAAEQGLRTQLQERAAEGMTPGPLLALAEDLLRAARIVLPAASTLERLVASVAAHAVQNLFDRVASGLPEHLRDAIEDIVDVPEGEHRSSLAHLKEPPPAARAPAIAASLAKFNLLEGLLGSGVDLAVTTPQLLQHLAQLGRRYDAQALKRFAAPKRQALVAAFLVETRKTLLDQVVTMHDQYMTGLERRSRLAFEDGVPMATEPKVRFSETLRHRPLISLN